MFEKFSVGFLMDDRKKKSKEIEELRERRRYANVMHHNRETLSNEITVALINFGILKNYE
jgi:hypothetical protein